MRRRWCFNATISSYQWQWVTFHFSIFGFMFVFFRSKLFSGVFGGDGRKVENEVGVDFETGVKIEVQIEVENGNL